MKLKIKGAIEIAHKLPNYEGACSFLHGHRFEYTATFKGEVGEDGMVEDFKFLKEVVENSIGTYDHTYLNDVFPNPTLELVATRFLKELNCAYKHERKGAMRGKFVTLEVWETSKYGVEVGED